MKRFVILAAFAVLSFLPTAAQGTLNSLDTDFRTRSSVGLDWKLAKGLHLEADYELRSESVLSRLDRHQATVGLSYKITPWLKAGVSYSYIHHHKTSAWSPRHRLNADLTFSYKTGAWRFSLKEQLRLTHKTESLNYCQEVRNPLVLKSRAKVQYKGFRSIEPYAYLEARNIFNDPSFSATWSTTSKAYANYQFTGYNSMYFNRFRGALGMEWKLSKHHAIDICAMADYCYDKNLDVDKTHTYLKSYTWDQALNGIVSIGYRFSF
ncbi:MAG: DUF2490 domain-containing protein [Bacteroidales bacterium]|nr:DUF2490 domain-containing protein [Bacteroidales bacterium]